MFAITFAVAGDFADFFDNKRLEQIVKFLGFGFIINVMRLIFSSRALGCVLHASQYNFGLLQVLAELDGYVLLIRTGRRALTRPVKIIVSWRNGVVRTLFHFGDAIAQLIGVVGDSHNIRLVSPRLQLRSDVRFVKHITFCPVPYCPDRFNAIRVTNLLNPSYFSEVEALIKEVLP